MDGKQDTLNLAEMIRTLVVGYFQLNDVFEMKDVELIEGHAMPDHIHIHILVKIPVKISV